MASPWKWIPQVMPIGDQEVWVRRLDFAEPFAATWDAVAHEFYTDDGLRMPWYLGIRWKPRVT